jgi:hypothetical protein
MVVRAGETECDGIDGTLTSSIDDLARADLVVRLREAAPDWWAPLEVLIDGEVAFTGSVLTAEPAAAGVNVSAASGIEMTETLMGIVLAEDFPAQDMVYASARAAGFTRDRMYIHGLEDLPREPIEIVTPLWGVTTERRVELGPLALLPVQDGLRALGPFRGTPDDVTAAWAGADAFGLVVRDAQTLDDAEESALEVIALGLAWLAVRTRFGYAVLPDQTVSRFNRETARTLPRREGVMAVRGLRTGRRWLRDPRSVARRGTLALNVGDTLWPPLEMRLATSDRLALLAARQVAATDDLVEAAAAISTAFEFYIGEISLEPTFTRDELDRLRADLPDWLNSEQARRAREVLGMVNQPSYGQRLRAAFQQDGVPLTEAEWKVLQRVRGVRNRAVHGSEALEIDADAIALATSILSRALVFRAARLNQQRLVD